MEDGTVKATEILIGVFLAALVALLFSWMTQEKIATQCERQGGFYVGSRDYVCSLKKQEPKQ